MVEQHDECLECLAKIKNRTDLYRTLADNIKPSNNVIKVSDQCPSIIGYIEICYHFLAPNPNHH